MDIRVSVDKHLGILTLVRGHQGGKRFWALISLYPSRYDEYAARISNGDEITVTDFGAVIEADFGTQPSPEKLEFFANTYGADYRFLTEGFSHARR